MKYTDRIYGNFEIIEPVILELINSPTIQRLKEINQSEIPEIIKKYNFDLEYILDDKNFPLKEKDLPDLCADRITYSLREAIDFGEIKNGKNFIDNLTTKDGKWILKNFESAKKICRVVFEIKHGLLFGIAFRRYV